MVCRSTDTRPGASDCAIWCPEKAGQEHHAAFEHDPPWDGAVSSGGGATTAVVFGAYVEKVLAPSLRPGQVVVMDNLGAHRPKRVRELIEERGCELLYLPTYSPDYKWDEKAEAGPRAALTMV
jgi:hypothetical protein